MKKILPLKNLREEINAKIAEIKLDSIGVKIDTLTDEQRAYLGL